jgi:pimeloyl-ACP methyl ester carboxylesterase
VVCTEDRSITVDAQRVMAARCRHVVELDASHSPFLSRPDAVADILEPLAREAS